MDTDGWLSESELAEAGPLVEAAGSGVLLTEGSSIFDKDGCVEVAIIRPCMSLGARLAGYRPIYEPSMLAENAPVFVNWPMFEDHLQESVQESLVAEGYDVAAALALIESEDPVIPTVVEARRRRQRKMRELGGRIIESWWDPTYVGPDDAVYGFQPGAVKGRALPQPAVKEKLAADPHILHVSINAFPKAAKRAKPSWAPLAEDGMAVAGIRAQPRGSVDWVIQAGAGGRVIVPMAPKKKVAEGRKPAERLQAALLGDDAEVSEATSTYSARNPERIMARFTDITTPEELREALREENPALAEAAFSTPTKLPETMTRADVEALLAEQAVEIERTITERTTELEEGIDDAAYLGRVAESRALQAETRIKRAGLPPTWERDLVGRYAVRESGPSPLLLVEHEDADDAVAKLEESIDRDVEKAQRLIAEAAGRPRVSGLGSGSAATGGDAGGSLFEDFLRESGDDPAAEGFLSTMIKEGR